MSDGTNTNAIDGAPPWRRASVVTILVGALAIIGAPVGLAIAGVLAVRDAEHRARWLLLACLALLVIIVLYVPVFFSEPRLDVVVSQ